MRMLAVLDDGWGWAHPAEHTPGVTRPGRPGRGSRVCVIDLTWERHPSGLTEARAVFVDEWGQIGTAPQGAMTITKVDGPPDWPQDNAGGSVRPDGSLA